MKKEVLIKLFEEEEEDDDETEKEDEEEEKDDDDDDGVHLNPYLEMDREMEDANIFHILAKNTDKDKQNKARGKRFFISFFTTIGGTCVADRRHFYADPARPIVHFGAVLTLAEQT